MELIFEGDIQMDQQKLLEWRLKFHPALRHRRIVYQHQLIRIKETEEAKFTSNMWYGTYFLDDKLMGDGELRGTKEAAKMSAAEAALHFLNMAGFV